MIEEQTTERCPCCGGTGYDCNDDDCPDCNGIGKITKDHLFQLIPSLNKPQITRKAGDIICNKDEYLVVDMGGCQMTAPRGSLEWQLRYGDPERVRLVAASALSSYEYLVLHCTKEEAWRRIKLIRQAMKENPDENY